ncbi:MAG: Nif3-like dinuclear metal center hexameric protein, partial [Planctomycetota bacterium]
MTNHTSGARKRNPPLIDVSTVCHALGKLAPLELAQEWDNVGLLAGDMTAAVQRLLLCIDLMPEVVEEAIAV